MTRTDALRLLSLPADAPADQIRTTVAQRLEEARSRVESAPTDALRAKYASTVAELEAAGHVLLEVASPAVPASLSHTMAEDLPAAVPSFTVGDADDGAAAGARLSIEQGQVLAGRYEIRERIGVGGMGAVFRAFDRNRDSEIAIKVMLPSLIGRGKAKERFLSEARLSSELSHPGIVNVFDVQNEGELFFLTMELLEGRTLREEMAEYAERHEPYPVERAVDVAKEVCAALDYAHGTTVHRDVKPENVFVCSDGHVKLMDFGIARVLSTSQLTMTGAAMGTAYYMAPEQLKGAKEVDGRADQYSVGVMLYELLTGEVPAGRIQPVRELRRGVSARLSNAIDRGLEPKPESRYASAGAFASALDGSSRRGSGRRGVGVPGGSRTVAAVAGVALVVALGWLLREPMQSTVEAWLSNEAEVLAHQNLEAFARVKALEPLARTARDGYESNRNALKKWIDDEERERSQLRRQRDLNERGLEDMERLDAVCGAYQAELAGVVERDFGQNATWRRHNGVLERSDRALSSARTDPQGENWLEIEENLKSAEAYFSDRSGQLLLTNIEGLVNALVERPKVEAQLDRTLEVVGWSALGWKRDDLVDGIDQVLFEADAQRLEGSFDTARIRLERAAQMSHDLGEQVRDFVPVAKRWREFSSRAGAGELDVPTTSEGVIGAVRSLAHEGRFSDAVGRTEVWGAKLADLRQQLDLVQDWFELAAMQTRAAHTELSTLVARSRELEVEIEKAVEAFASADEEPEWEDSIRQIAAAVEGVPDLRSVVSGWTAYRRTPAFVPGDELARFAREVMGLDLQEGKMSQEEREAAAVDALSKAAWDEAQTAMSSAGIATQQWNQLVAAIEDAQRAVERVCKAERWLELDGFSQPAALRALGAGIEADLGAGEYAGAKEAVDRIVDSLERMAHDLEGSFGPRERVGLFARPNVIDLRARVSKALGEVAAELRTGGDASDPAVGGLAERADSIWSETQKDFALFGQIAAGDAAERSARAAAVCILEDTDTSRVLRRTGLDLDRLRGIVDTELNAATSGLDSATTQSACDEFKRLFDALKADCQRVEAAVGQLRTIDSEVGGRMGEWGPAGTGSSTLRPADIAVANFGSTLEVQGVTTIAGLALELQRAKDEYVGRWASAEGTLDGVRDLETGLSRDFKEYTEAEWDRAREAERLRESPDRRARILELLGKLRDPGGDSRASVVEQIEGLVANLRSARSSLRSDFDEEIERRAAAAAAAVAAAAAAARERYLGERSETSTLGGANLTLIRCAEDTYWMGSPSSEPGRDDDEERRRVPVGEFWIGETEVTQGQWQAVMGTRPWSGEGNVKTALSYPATYLNWNDVVEFCRLLTERERGEGLPMGYAYRLPTEEEWEYACRAGTRTAYSFGDNRKALSRFAVYGISASPSKPMGFAGGSWNAHPAGVKSKDPNPWGLFDMHGNVWEWTSSLYDGGPERVGRGGGWRNDAQYCRSANRNWDDPGSSNNDLGFRVVLAASSGK